MLFLDVVLNVLFYKDIVVNDFIVLFSEQAGWEESDGGADSFIYTDEFW